MIITHGDSYKKAWKEAKINRREQFLETRTKLFKVKFYDRDSIKRQLGRLTLTEKQIDVYLKDGIINLAVADILRELITDNQ